MALASKRVGVLSREIKLGDRVLLYQDARRKWIAKVEPGRFHTHRGYFELGELVGREYGGALPANKGPNPPVVQAPAHHPFGIFFPPPHNFLPKEIGYRLLFLCTAKADK